MQKISSLLIVLFGLSIPAVGAIVLNWETVRPKIYVEGKESQGRLLYFYVST